MDIQLLVRVDNKPEKKVTVNKDVIIGRSKTCQFRVLSNDVSREHCKLLVSDEVIAIRDLGSSNGTLVNGKTIPTGIDVLLHPGANIEVGPLKFIVQFEAKHKIAPPPASAAAKPTASAKPAKSKATAATADKPAATGGAAAATVKKKAAKKPAPAAEEPGFPFAVPGIESDDGPAWPDFLLGDKQASNEPSAEGPTVATPSVDRVSDVSETEDFSFGGPPEADADEPFFDFGGDEEPTVMPGVITPTASTRAAESTTAVAKSDFSGQSPATATVAQTASDDEPVFGEFNGGDDDSAFVFDPEAIAASASVAPTIAPKPAGEQQPGKLKSLFGLFGKNKAAAPSAAAKPTATAPTSVAPVTPAVTSAASGDDNGLNSFLTGGSETPSGSPDDDDTPDWMKQLS